MPRHLIATRIFVLAALLTLSLSGVTDTHAGELDPSQESWHKRYKKQANAPKPEDMLLNTDKEPDLTEGFKPLFNGKDLTGWKPLGGKCKFSVKDGAILGEVVKGSPSTYLSTEKADFKDFVFTCDMKWLANGNSGVMFRAKQKPGKNKSVTVYGPQAEMEEFGKNRGWSGGIYGQSCGGYWYPLWLKEHKAARVAMTDKDAWHRVTIHAKGKVVKTWVNGVPAAHWVDEKNEYPKGFFGLQIHSGKSGAVLWKNLRYKPLPSEDSTAKKDAKSTNTK